MDADALLNRSVAELGYSSLNGMNEGELVQLALRFAIWPSVSTYQRSPWLAPFAIRKQRIRTEPNAPGPKRDLWGLPNEDGYFTDDNSLIKGLVINKPLSTDTNIYDDKKIRKGLVCCHIWSGTTGSPLLFSFTPNLVWLPKSLAAYSDAHLVSQPHAIHHALKQVSRERYELEHTNSRVAEAWSKLEAPKRMELGAYTSTEIRDDGKISVLAINRISRMINFIEAILDPDPTLPSRFSKRYHAGVGVGIDHSVMNIQDWLSTEKLRQLLTEMYACL